MSFGGGECEKSFSPPKKETPNTRISFHKLEGELSLAGISYKVPKEPQERVCRPIFWTFCQSAPFLESASIKRDKMVLQKAVWKNIKEK